MKKILLKILNIVIMIYFMVAFLIFTPYYNWTYAKEHGFVEWIFFGEVVATSKAITWPYFALLSQDNFQFNINNAIITAIKNKNISKANRLLKSYQINPNIKDKNGTSLLMLVK